MIDRRLLLVSLLAALLGCGDKGSGKSAASGAAPGAAPSGARPVVISRGADGKTRVEGTDEMKGDPTICTAMRACCAASSDVNLFCALSQATDGADCASVLKSTQSYLTERKLAKPAGCP